MEKNSFLSSSKSSKDITNGGRETTKGISSHYSWENSSDQDNLGDGGDFFGGFSWPPRSYTCTFCRREFRSAQALGGHMNVHRRDRARLRQIPPLPPPPPSTYNLLNLNLDPNPNPNPNFSPTIFSSSTSSSKLPPLISPPRSSLRPSSRSRVSENLTSMKSQKTLFALREFEGFSNEKEGEIVENPEITRLNLEMGLFCESKSDDLDLELRLGCS